MTAESIVLLLVNAVDSIPAVNQDEEDVKLETPIVRWKKLLGNKNPEEAKAEGNKSLRALFGVDDIRNGFYGSDDPISANKERDMILSFCFPPNLEHANSTGRLDLFALYGPIVKYHSVDYCFCRNCVRIAKDQLNISIREKEAQDRKKMGLTQTSGLGDSAMGASMGASGKVASMRGVGS